MVTLKPSTSHWKNVNESKLYQIDKRAAPNPHEHKATFELRARGGIAPAWLDAHPPWRPGCPCPAVFFARGPWERVAFSVPRALPDNEVWPRLVNRHAAA